MSPPREEILWRIDYGSISERVTTGMIKFRIDSPLIAYYYAISNVNGELLRSRGIITTR